MQVSRRRLARPSYLPKPRLGACTLAANGRADAEVSGEVCGASASTNKQNSRRLQARLVSLLLLAETRAPATSARSMPVHMHAPSRPLAPTAEIPAPVARCWSRWIAPRARFWCRRRAALRSRVPQWRQTRSGHPPVTDYRGLSNRAVAWAATSCLLERQSGRLAGRRCGSVLGAASLHRVGLAHLRVRCLSGVTPGTVSYVEQCIASPTVHPSEALPGTRDRSSRRAAPR
jgi:hypothetical protein